METTRKKQLRPVSLVYTALGTALIAVCAWISIPAPVPFTMQTFAVFFVLSVLGGKRGTAAIACYILLGAMGVPVFAQFASGIGYLLGVTGGYIVGFLASGLLYWLIVSLAGKKLWVELVAMLLGLLVLYAFGTAWYLLVYLQKSGAVGLTVVLSRCVIPFILPDLIKLGLAVTLARRLAPVVR